MHYFNRLTEPNRGIRNKQFTKVHAALTELCAAGTYVRVAPKCPTLKWRWVLVTIAETVSAKMATLKRHVDMSCSQILTSDSNDQRFIHL